MAAEFYREGLAIYSRRLPGGWAALPHDLRKQVSGPRIELSSSVNQGFGVGAKPVLIATDDFEGLTPDQLDRVVEALNAKD